MSAKHHNPDSAQIARLPNWTNFHNKEAFTTLSDSLRKNANWDSTELLLLELLMRFAKTATVTVKAFFAAIPSKYLNNITPNERTNTILSFFEKLAAADMCSVIHRADESGQIEKVKLTEPASTEDRKKKELITPALNYLRSFYLRRDFKVILQDGQAHLPNPEGIDAHSHLSAAVLVNFHCSKIESLLFSSKEMPNPLPQLTQENFAASELPFLLIHFPGLTAFDQSKRHHLAEKESDQPELPFSIVLPQDVIIKDLVKDFMVPLILCYLQEEKNKDVYKTIHHEWSKKIHSSVGDSQLDPDARIERTLLNADLSDGAYYASVHVLTHVLRHLKLRNLPSAPSPIIYEATRFIYDHAIACRQMQNLDKLRKAEQAKDQEIIINFLLKDVYFVPEGASIAGPMPVELKRIEDLEDCSKRFTLGAKYKNVKDLLPLGISSLDQVPRVLVTDGKYLHRWHLVNHYLLMQHLESARVQRKLAIWWSETAIPRPNAIEIPDHLISEEFIRTILLVNEYRNGAKIELVEKQIGREFEVFLHYFFPTREMARSYKVEHLLRTESTDNVDAKGPKLIVRNDLDKVIYRDIRSFALAPYQKMLHLEYSAMRKTAIELVRKRLGRLGYLLFMLRSLLGMSDAAPAPAADGSKNDSGRSGSNPIRRNQARSSPKAGPTISEQKTIQELEEVLAKIPRVLRIEARQLQGLVEPIVKNFNPDIRNLGDEEARTFVKNFILKSPRLNALPYRADPIFVRYVLLLMRKNNSRS